MNCSGCAWSGPAIAEEDGSLLPILECHRYPPVLVVLDGEITSVRPQVDGNDLCGEFEEADD